jgi:outer membrane protein OmpA-like peptidoglycan-associated protein
MKNSRFALKCGSVAVLFFALGLSQSFAQPGRSRLSTQNKKALKWYDRAMDEMADLRRGDARVSTDDVLSAILKSTEADPEFAEPHFLAGSLWADLEQWERSVAANNAGLLVDAGIHPRAYLANARMLQQLLQPALMRDAATGYLDFIASDRTRNLSTADSSEVALLIASADFMQSALKTPSPYAPQALGPTVNTADPEYFPTLFDGGDRLLFTRKFAPSIHEEPQEDFFVSGRLLDGSWSLAQPVTALNTPENEGAPSVSLDGRILVFTRCGAAGGAGSCDLYMSASRGGDFSDWQPPVNISALNTSRWESQPCLTWDGSAMVFTREKTSDERDRRQLYRRTTDLFESSIDWDANSWRKPHPMPAHINTPGREQSGFFHPDGRHFYFASDGHPGMGGMDIFVCTLQDDGSWGEPLNLGHPINTPGDETGLIISPDGRTAIFSKASSDAAAAAADDIGGMDLYSFELPEAARSAGTGWFRAAVVSKSTDRPLPARVTLTDLETGRVLADLQASVAGLFAVPVPTDRPFALQVEHAGYLLFSGHFSSNADRSEQKGSTQLIGLQPLKGGAEITLENIFFGSGSASLDASSTIELRKVLKLVELNPAARFEVGGHTDAIGSPSDNLRLSQLRADAVVAWLTAHGIASDRLESVGYGESRPASPADSESDATEKGRAANRRTTLSIL